MNKVSAIIPTLNEGENIKRLLHRLQEHGGDNLEEVIVVDAGSTDATVAIAEKCGARCMASPQKGRAWQMNYGASQARADIFYFVHADTLPPTTYMRDVLEALEEGYAVGCFRYQFDSPKMLLKINAYFTRFDLSWCRGGDQSLFISRSLFDEMDGFRNDYRIMEDFDFIKRVRKNHDFRIIQKDMLVSARKYDTNSYLRVQIANLIVFNMYRFGASQDAMVNAYAWLLDYR